MNLRFDHELDRLERDLGKIGPCVVKKSAPVAANRVAKSVQSVAVKAVAKTTGIKQKDVRSAIRVRLANRQELRAYVDAAEGKAKNLIEFVTPSQRKPSGGRGQAQFFRKRATRSGKFLKQGVKAKAWNKPKVYKGSFIARTSSGKALVLRRTGAGRGAGIKALSGPSIRTEFNREPIQRAMRERANQRIPIEMDRAIKRNLRRCVPKR